MAYNLGTLVTRVQQRLDNTGISSTKLKQWINDTQREICNGRNLRFMETSQSYTLNVGTSDITNGNGLPSTFQTPINLRNTYTGYVGVIPFINYNELVEKHPGLDADTAGAPQYAYVYGNTIKVYPEPDVAYTVTLDYYKYPTELSSDSDTPNLPEQFGELLVLGTWKRALEHDDDFDQAAVVQSKFDELLIDTIRQTSLRVAEPSIMRINRKPLYTVQE